MPKLKTKPNVARYGPSAVTATAVHVTKAIACKIMNIPQARSLVLPKFIATPNRAHFQLMHPEIRNCMDPGEKIKTNLELQQELNKEVNRVIRQNFPINVYSNLTIAEALKHFGSDVIDRFHDINEPEFTQFLNAEFMKVFGKPMFTNSYEANHGPFLERRRYRQIDGIEVDMKEAISSFLDEVGGNELDLLPPKELQFLRSKKVWMQNNQMNNENTTLNADNDVGNVDELDTDGTSPSFPEFNGQRPRTRRNTRQNATKLNAEDVQSLLKRQWTSTYGVFHTVTNTDWTKASSDLRVNVIEIPGLFDEISGASSDESTTKKKKEKNKKKENKSASKEETSEKTSTQTESQSQSQSQKTTNKHSPFVAICLSASRTGMYTNSENITDSSMYLKSTGELGRVVVTQTRYIGHHLCPKQHIYLDVFPGYEAKGLGTNPYVLLRENFNLTHLASVIPYNHSLKIPQVAEIKDGRSVAQQNLK